MYRLVFDSDAIIKLVKSGISKDTFRKIDGHISEKVYEETVIVGRKGHHHDAEIIEMLVREKLLKKDKIRFVAHESNLGSGELSTLALFEGMKADAIISDDKAFIHLLISEDIPFMPSGQFIIFLWKKKLIEKNGAEDILSRLMDFIGTKEYNHYKFQLEEK